MRKYRNKQEKQRKSKKSVRFHLVFSLSTRIFIFICMEKRKNFQKINSNMYTERKSMYYEEENREKFVKKHAHLFQFDFKNCTTTLKRRKIKFSKKEVKLNTVRKFLQK